MNVKTFRLVNGQTVVAEFLDEDDTSITVQRGIGVRIDAEGNYQSTPWELMVDPERPQIKIDKIHIVYTAPLDKKSEEAYIKNVTMYLEETQKPTETET